MNKQNKNTTIVVGQPQFLIILDLVAASIDSLQSLDICAIYSENTALVPRPYIVTVAIQWPVYNTGPSTFHKNTDDSFCMSAFFFIYYM